MNEVPIRYSLGYPTQLNTKRVDIGQNQSRKECPETMHGY